jgi:hypothetical protein
MKLSFTSEDREINYNKSAGVVKLNLITRFFYALPQRNKKVESEPVLKYIKIISAALPSPAKE